MKAAYRAQSARQRLQACLQALGDLALAGNEIPPLAGVKAVEEFRHERGLIIIHRPFMRSLKT